MLRGDRFALCTNELCQVFVVQAYGRDIASFVSIFARAVVSLRPLTDTKIIVLCR